MTDDAEQTPSPPPTHHQFERKGEVIRQIALEGLTVHRLARELQHGPKPFDQIVLVSLPPTA